MIDTRSTVYISGKMTGLPDLGKSIMDNAEELLRDAGYINIINPYYEVDQTKNIKWSEAMIIDIQQIMSRNVKAMFLIDNWKESKGAFLEVIIFIALGIPIFNLSGRYVSKDVLAFMDPLYILEMLKKMNKQSVSDDGRDGL